MTIRRFQPTAYYPSSPRSGTEGELVFRMQNMLIRGEGSESYAEVYGGSKDLNETIPTGTLTGTIACAPSTTTITGTGTLFTTELHPSQFVLLHSGVTGLRVLVIVDEIVDDTHFIATHAPYLNDSGLTGSKMPVLFDLNRKRGTLLHGNAVQLDLATILCVGDGTLRRNGSVLPGTSLVASKNPKIGIFNSSTGNYSVFTLGMATPATLTAADGGAGVRAVMKAGKYSIRACAARIATGGYNNPSPRASVTLTADGDMITGTFPAADTTNGQDAWMIFVTTFTEDNADQGPWWRFEQGTQTIVVQVGAGAGQIPAAGGTYNIEYLDAEVAGNDLLSFNNLVPPKAEYIGYVGGIPVWVSTQGPGGNSPGPLIAPAKPNNIEAAPPEWYTSPSPPDEIVGFYIAQGRLYLMCVNTLQVAEATQSLDPRIPPLVIRPYWKSGFKNPYSLLFVDGFLIGMTNHGLARSLAEGDEGGEEFNWAQAVTEILSTIDPSFVMLGHDPINNAICVFMPGTTLNVANFWETRVLVYGLRQRAWIGDILLTDTTHDCFVTGVATVNGQLEFLMGGRTNAATTVVKTYRWDTQDTGSVPWYIAWQFSDWGAADRPKRVGPYFAPVALINAGGTAGIHGAEPGDSIPLTTLQTDNSGSKSGSISLPATTTVTEYNEVEVNCTNLKQFTVRVDGTWSQASANRDRVDGIVVEAVVLGAAR